MLGVPKDRQVVHIMFLLLNTQWWIDSRPTICSFVQGSQQVRRSHNGIELTLASVARLVVRVNGMGKKILKEEQKMPTRMLIKYNTWNKNI